MSDDELAEPEKDPSDATDGDEPMTSEQRAEIESLDDGSAVPEGISRAEAAALIDQLRHQTGD